MGAKLGSSGFLGADGGTRQRKGDPKLAALARERQDLVAEWQKRDALRNAALGQESAKRNPQAEAENNARLAAIDARIKEIDKELAVKFPDYAALTSPAPLGVEEVQAQLGADEALVLFLDTPEGEVDAGGDLHLGCDQNGYCAGCAPIWARRRSPARCKRCAAGSMPKRGRTGPARNSPVEATRTRTGDAGKPLPFDHARAHRLYQALFGQAEDLIKGKQLLIVPSGALTQLPFQVLVTAPPASGDQRSAAWLIRDHALTVLPAVSSLKALRRVARPSAASKPMIGFGNPLLDGHLLLDGVPAHDAAIKSRVRSATENQRCSEYALAAFRVPARLASRAGAGGHTRRPCRCGIPTRAESAARDGEGALRCGARLERRSATRSGSAPARQSAR